MNIFIIFARRFNLMLMENRKKIYGYSAIIAAVLLWGASFVWTKELLVKEFPVFTIVLCRMVIASCVLLLLFKTTGQIEKVSRKDFPLFFLLSLFEPFLYYIGENFGLLYVSPSIAAAIIALVPIVTAISLSTLNKEKLRAELFIGAAISVIGIMLMSFTSSSNEISIKGLLLMLLAVVSAALYGTTLQQILKRGYGPVTITTWQNMIAVVLYLPCFLIFDAKHVTSLDWNVSTIGSLLTLGVLCSAAAFALYSAAAKIVTVAKASVFSNAIPVVTLCLSVLMGTESITAQKIIGILVVVGGVIISQRTASAKKTPQIKQKDRKNV